MIQANTTKFVQNCIWPQLFLADTPMVGLENLAEVNQPAWFEQSYIFQQHL